MESGSIKHYFEYRDAGGGHEEALKYANLPANFKPSLSKVPALADVENEIMKYSYSSSHYDSTDPFRKIYMGNQSEAKKVLRKVNERFGAFVTQCVGESMDWKRGIWSCIFYPEKYHALVVKKQNAAAC